MMQIIYKIVISISRFAIVNTAIVLWRYIGFPIATALALAIAGFFLSPPSGKWILGFFAVPLGLIQETTDFKLPILLISLVIATLVVSAPIDKFNRWVNRLCISTILVIGVAFAWNYYNNIHPDSRDGLDVLWVVASVMTGSTLPAVTFLRFFTQQASDPPLE